MNPIFFYSNDYIKESDIVNREFEIAITEAAMMTEQVTRQLKINMALSELKVLQENGTADDLALLLLEAGEEAAQQNQGIFSSIFSAIAKFFQGIANALGGFTKQNKADIEQLKAQNAQVTIDGKTNELINNLQQMDGKLTEAANASDHKVLKTALIAAAGSVGLFAIFKATGKLLKQGETETSVQVPAADAEQKLNFINSFAAKLGGLFKKKADTMAAAGNNMDGRQEVQSKMTDDQKAKLAAHKAKAQNANDKRMEQDAQNKAKFTQQQVQTQQTRTEENNAVKDARQQEWQRQYDRIKNQRKDISDEAAKKYADQMVNSNPNFKLNFTGFYESVMTEASESDDAESNKALQFIQSIVNKVKDTLTNGISAAINAIKTGAGAVKGAVQNVLPGNNQQPVANQFIGDVYEESGPTEIDPIDAMLSGLAFGGAYA